MKKIQKKALLGAFAMAATVGFTACRNTPASVYGPPEYFEDEIQEDVEMTQEFSAEYSVPACVYGPPEYFADQEDEIEVIVEDELNTESK